MQRKSLQIRRRRPNAFQKQFKYFQQYLNTSGIYVGWPVIGGTIKNGIVPHKNIREKCGDTKNRPFGVVSQITSPSSIVKTNQSLLLPYRDLLVSQ